MGHAIVLICDRRKLLLPIWLQNVAEVSEYWYHRFYQLITINNIYNNT